MPTIFNSSNAAIPGKMNLARVAVFDLAATRRNIDGVVPDMQIFELSFKISASVETVTDFFRNQLASSRQACTADGKRLQPISTTPQQTTPIGQVPPSVD